MELVGGAVVAVVGRGVVCSAVCGTVSADGCPLVRGGSTMDQRAMDSRCCHRPVPQCCLLQLHCVTVVSVSVILCNGPIGE